MGLYDSGMYTRKFRKRSPLVPRKFPGILSVQHHSSCGLQKTPSCGREMYAERTRIASRVYRITTLTPAVVETHHNMQYASVVCMIYTHASIEMYHNQQPTSGRFTHRPTRVPSPFPASCGRTGTPMPSRHEICASQQSPRRKVHL